jgi:hypothetical protein
MGLLEMELQEIELQEMKLQEAGANELKLQKSRKTLAEMRDVLAAYHGPTLRIMEVC